VVAGEDEGAGGESGGWVTAGSRAVGVD